MKNRKFKIGDIVLIIDDIYESSIGRIGRIIADSNKRKVMLAHRFTVELIGISSTIDHFREEDLVLVKDLTIFEKIMYGIE